MPCWLDYMHYKTCLSCGCIIKPVYPVDSFLECLTEALADVRCWHAVALTGSRLSICVEDATDIAETMDKERTAASRIMRHQPANRSYMLHQIADSDRTFRNW